MLTQTFANDVRQRYETDNGLFVLDFEFYGGRRYLSSRTEFATVGWDNDATRTTAVVEFHPNIYVDADDRDALNEEVAAAFEFAAEVNDMLAARSK